MTTNGSGGALANTARSPDLMRKTGEDLQALIELVSDFGNLAAARMKEAAEAITADLNALRAAVADAKSRAESIVFQLSADVEKLRRNLEDLQSMVSSHSETLLDLERVIGEIEARLQVVEAKLDEGIQASSSVESEESEPSGQDQQAGAWKARMAQAEEWVKSNIVFDEGAMASVPEVMKAYEKWCQSLGLRPVRTRSMGFLIRKLAGDKEKVKSIYLSFRDGRKVWAWSGIRLATETPEH